MMAPILARAVKAAIRPVTAITDPSYASLGLHHILVAGSVVVLLRGAWLEGAHVDFWPISAAIGTLVGTLVGAESWMAKIRQGMPPAPSEGGPSCSDS